jgi:voltage-gated potassium channel Kch
VNPEAAGRRHALEWMLVAGLAALSLVLGTIGFVQVLEGTPHAWTEPLYRSLQLFVLESGAVDQSAPLSLDIARVLAPLVAAYAAVRAVLALFHERLQLIGLRYRLRRHVVISGLGTKGFTLAKALARAGERVVVIERDEGNPAIAGCRRRDIPVLRGDATDRVLLQRAQVPQARALIVVVGDDRANIDIAFAAADVASAAGQPSLTALVHLDDLGLWRLLQAEALAKRARLPFRLDFFSVREAAARALLDEHVPFAPAEPGVQRRAHLLVVGADGLGESVILRAAGMWQASDPDVGDELRITVAGQGARAQLDGLRSREPALDGIAAIDAVEAPVSSLGAAVARRAIRDGAFTAAYVCLESEAEGLAIALALQARRELAGVPIAVTVADERAGIALAMRGQDLEDIHTFGVIPRTLTPALLERGTNELLARAKHEHYLQCERERGSPSEGNASMRPWPELEESLKESNRRFADNIGGKLEAAGCTLVPAPLADPDAPKFAFTDAEVEELARAEHDRWWHDLVRDGWTFGPEKDPERKRHPKLVPWSELTEEDRDKDREPVRALPHMLARVGFEIQRGEATTLADRLERSPV